VIHIATGRELIAPEQTPAAGEIRDSNSTLVAAELAAAGADLVGQSRCGDELAALVHAIDSHPAGWDVLLISGGASVGDYDFGRRALAELGFTIHFTKLDLRPGKPLIFASRGAQVAFVIPGNPVSHFVLFHVAIRAALEALEGAVESWPEMTVALTEPIPGRANPRTTFWPAVVSIAGGELVARPLRWQSSGDLTGLAGANALIRIPGNSPPPRERAECLLLRGGL
jgi:molybdopterin molybdotransferase